jgi:DNA (cytosine-5)-methyltransferase 1
MRHGSLFSGIGGFDLASEWMGWENVFHCEWNSFGQKVLNYYWPKAISYHDITKTDFSIHRGSIDILTGGFPCQPYSSAGKRLGKEDERHLWPEMLRAIREIQPTWVVGENVRGLTNWNGGLVFDEVQAELEAQGYEVTPFLLPACAVNAPHRRDRIWFVAFNSKSKRNTKVGRIRERKDNESIGICKENIVAFKDTNSNGWSSDIGQSQSCERKQWDTCTGNNERISTNNEEAFDAADSDLYGCNECDCNNEVNTSERGINALSHINKGDVNGNAPNSNGIGCYNRSDNWEERYICRDQGFAEENKSEWNRRKRGTREISSNAADSERIRLEYGTESRQIRGEEENSIGKRNKSSLSTKAISNGRKPNWNNFPTVSPICDGDDGISDRLDSITFPKWRNESIKAGGNAIVPQVVHQIFKAIEQYETTRQA